MTFYTFFYPISIKFSAVNTRRRVTSQKSADLSARHVRKKKLLRDSDFGENRRTEPHTVLMSVTEFLPVLYIFALHYNPEGRGFDSQWCNWNFSLT
jgi:hypothetical protein